MKIRPVILCGGEGTRLWPKLKNNQAKQFINFGGWTLFQQTILRIKNPIFDNLISKRLLLIFFDKKYFQLSMNLVLKCNFFLD